MNSSKLSLLNSPSVLEAANQIDQAGTLRRAERTLRDIEDGKLALTDDSDDEFKAEVAENVGVRFLQKPDLALGNPVEEPKSFTINLGEAPADLMESLTRQMNQLPPGTLAKDIKFTFCPIKKVEDKVKLVTKSQPTDNESLKISDLISKMTNGIKVPARKTSAPPLLIKFGTHGITEEFMKAVFPSDKAVPSEAPVVARAILQGLKQERMVSFKYNIEESSFVGM